MEAVIWRRPCVLVLRSCRPLATCGGTGTRGFRNGGRAPQRRFIVRNINSAGSGAVVARPSSALKTKRSEGVDGKLVALRQLFHKPPLQMDAYIIPSQDPHQKNSEKVAHSLQSSSPTMEDVSWPETSKWEAADFWKPVQMKLEMEASSKLEMREGETMSEFIAECFMRRAFISGFTGSAGTAVVTKDKASLWTDGRYFLQAENQLGPDWILMRAGTAGVPTISEWLTDVLSPGSKVGIDPFLFSSDAAEELKQTLSTKDHRLVYVYDGNLVDETWKEDRPKPPTAPVRVHDIKYAGLDVPSKITSLRQNLMGAGATSIVISMLDEVAWLLNLRGNDVAHSPVAYAYLIVELESTTLFIDPLKITPEVMIHLKNSNVTVKPYGSLLLEVERLANCGAKLWLDTSCTNVAIVDAFYSACDKYFENLAKRSKQKNIKERKMKLLDAKSTDIEMEGPSAIHKTSPVAIAKAIKNEAELNGMRQAHLRDAAALAEFWTWLETKVVQDKMTLTEVEVADRLLEFRSKQAGFLDTSFDTISGSGENGAIIHYRAQPDTCNIVDDKKLYLLDSGGQYVDGTTDVTRTVHLGEPSLREKECFTRVLQGHIALDQAIFPENTPGFVLDVLARSSLWKIGLDYRHGTGHGVGASLNVHEGPQGISYRYENMTGLQGGMIVSNEPGYYEDRSFGIRIENLVIVREVETPNRFGGNIYLGFEKLTFVPIQSKLLDLSLMSPAEIEWLNNYHSEVWEKVSPLVQGNVREWLWKNTQPVSIHSTP